MDELYCEVCATPLERPRFGPPPRFCKVCRRRKPTKRRPLAQLDALLQRQRDQGMDVPQPRSRLMRNGRRF